MDPTSFPGLLEPRTLFFFALFVVPGWLMRLFYRRYVPEKAQGFGTELVSVISLSLLLLSISGLVLMIIHPWPILGRFWLLFAVAILPALIAYAYLQRRIGSEVSFPAADR